MNFFKNLGAFREYSGVANRAAYKVVMSIREAIRKKRLSFGHCPKVALTPPSFWTSVRLLLYWPILDNGEVNF